MRVDMMLGLAAVISCKADQLGRVDDPRIAYAEGALSNIRGGWKKAPSEFPGADALISAVEADLGGRIRIEKLTLREVRGWCPTQLCPPPRWEIDADGAGALAFDTLDEVPATTWLVACGLPADPVPPAATGSDARVFRSRGDKGRPMTVDGNFVIGKEPDGTWTIGRSRLSGTPRANPSDRPGANPRPEFILLDDARFAALCDRVRGAPAAPAAP